MVPKGTFLTMGKETLTTILTYLHYSCRPTFFFGHRGNAPISLKIYFAQLILQNKELAAKVSSTITYLFELQKQHISVHENRLR